MRYGSVCSGVEAASLAWEPLGWQPAWFAEIEPFPCAVLAHHWPHVPNHGDMTKLEERILSEEIEAPDILVGGTPCQAFSLAGLRQSLSDERGNLTLTFVRIANAIDIVRQRHGKPPCVIVWENVPGVLNTKDNAFGTFLAALAGENDALPPEGGKWLNAGFLLSPRRDIEWRVLNAQYFGVPQRRRRVFLVASAGIRAGSSEILFERAGETGHLAAGGSAGQETAAFVESSFGVYRADTVGGTVKDSDGVCSGESEIIVVNGRQDPYVSDKAYALDCQNAGNTNVVCVADPAATLTLGFGARGVDADQIANDCVISGIQVRRLTPLECERLQGFPDNHTQIPWRSKPAAECPDSLRYKAIGNSMAVPVMRWIGARINNYLNNKEI